MNDDEHQRLGAPVPDWQPPQRPTVSELRGDYVQLERLSAARHAEALFAAFQGQDHVWDYMPYGPFPTAKDYAAWVASTEATDDPTFFAIRSLQTGRWEGVASFLRIAPEAGSVEVGHINFSPSLQGTRAATDAMFVMMRWAFDAGYRRYEWKCNALNRASRRAAQRLGLSYEGVFRQATVVKGRNRDTAWFAAIDREWDQLRAAFETWLDPANFDTDGAQRSRLSTLTEPVLVARDPAL